MRGLGDRASGLLLLLRRLLGFLRFLFLGLFVHGRLYRADQHVRIASLELRLPLYLTVLFQVAGETEQQLAAQIGVRNFASAELDDSLHTISFFQEADRMILFEIVVVIVGIGPEFQLFYLDDVLLFLSFVLFLLVLILPLAIIHGFGNRRNCGGRDDNQIQAEFFGALDSFHGGQYSDCTVREDCANFREPNRFVDVFSNSNAWTAGRIIPGRKHR